MKTNNTKQLKLIKKAVADWKAGKFRDSTAMLIIQQILYKQPKLTKKQIKHGKKLINKAKELTSEDLPIVNPITAESWAETCKEVSDVVDSMEPEFEPVDIPPYDEEKFIKKFIKSQKKKGMIFEEIQEEKYNKHIGL